MTDGDALLRAVLADPADDLPRLVYADWLEETGADPDRVELIRLQVRAARLEPGECLLDACRDVDEDGHPCPFDWCEATDSARRRVEHKLDNADYGSAWFAGPWASDYDEGFWGWSGGDGFDFEVTFGRSVDGADDATLCWYRGFVWKARMSLAAWLTHGSALARHHPLERVELSDRRPLLDASWLWVGDGLWDRHLTESPCRLPLEVARHLRPELQSRPDYGPGDAYTVRFATEEEAVDALSTACITWARLNPTSRGETDPPRPDAASAGGAAHSA